MLQCVVVYALWSLNSSYSAGRVGGRRDSLAMAPLLLFGSMAGFLILAAITEVELLPGQWSF